MESKQIDVYIRWMIRRDMAEVVEIEKRAFEFPWAEEQFVACLRQRDCIGMVAEHDERVVGFMIYELKKDQLHVLNFAVDSRLKRLSIGRQMVDKLVGKLSRESRNKIILEVRESNLAALNFFKSQGFRCESILRDYYEVPTEDAFVMVYRYGGPQKPMEPKNRISRHAV